MKLVFEENRKRKWNELNEKSVKLRLNDFDMIDECDEVSFFDDNGNKILECELYLPEDKAYIILERINVEKNYINNDKKEEEVIKMFITHLLNPNNIKHITSAIYFEEEGCGIPTYIIQELGFCELSEFDYFNGFLINKNFEQIISSIPISDEVKSSILQDYRALERKYNLYQNNMRKKLEQDKYYLEVMKKEGWKEEDIKDKEIDILHYQRMLGISPENETSR